MRAEKQKDAKLIVAALLDVFKRKGDFVLHMTGAHIAVERMPRAMIPRWKGQDGRPWFQLSTFVAKQIMGKRTGCYFEVEPA